MGPRGQSRAGVFAGLMMVAQAAVTSQELRVGLAPTDYGMFAGEIALAPIEGHACRALALSMTISGCLGEGGEVIECPEVRVRAPDGFEAFSAGGTGVAVCRD